MSNNLNIRSQTTLRELEESLSQLNVPIVLFKELLTSIKNNDFSNLAGSISKLRYQTSEEKVKEQIDNVIYQQIYNNTDYNNLILLITKIYSVIDSLVEARMNITDVYKQDIEVVEDMLESYGFDIHKIFDENAKRDLAQRIYYFLRRKGTPHLIGEFLNRLGYTHYVINEYSLNRDNMEWKLIPENVEISEAAKEWENDIIFNNVDLDSVDDALWYLDENTLDDILFKNTRLFPKDWAANYEITEYDFLSKYLGLSITDEVTIDSVSFSECGEKMAVACSIWFTGWKQISDTEFEPVDHEIKDGFGNTLMYLDDEYISKKSVFIINLITNEVEKEYVMYDNGWYAYYENWYLENYPNWEPYTEYKKGDIVIYDDDPVICERDHISASTFNYKQDGIRTWYDCSIDDQWWAVEGYISKDHDMDYWTNFTTYFEDLNNIYIVPDMMYTGELLKINMIDNTVTTITFGDFKNKFTDITFKDFFGDRYKYNYYNIIGKYGDYLIFDSPYNDNANDIYISNTFLFFNLKEKTWFSLYDRFFKYYPTTSFETNPFDLYYGFYKNQIMQNKLWFTVYINHQAYLMGLDLKDILSHIEIIDSFGPDTFIENVEQKENYVKNVMDNYFKISLDDFDYDYTVEFLVGRDGYIYVSGTLWYEPYMNMLIFQTFEYYNVLRVYDKNGNYVKELLNGSVLSPWGMDYNNNLIITVSTDAWWWSTAVIYITCDPEYAEDVYYFPIMKLKPSTDNIDKIENKNIIFNNVTYLKPDDMDYTPYELIFNKCPQPEVLTTYTYIHGLVYNNELYIFHENHIDKYNTLTNCWKDVSPPLPHGFIFYKSGKNVLYNKNAYIFSSIFSFIYNLETKKYVEKDIPYSFDKSDSFIAERIENKIYIFGGYIAYNHYIDRLWEYDIINDSWTQKTSCPTGYAYHSSTVYNNKIYIFGGKSSSGNSNDTWEYDPSTDTWTQKADFPGSTSSRPNDATTIGDKMYYYVNREMWEYDPIANTWTSKASGSSEMPNYGGFVMETINDKAYLFGGSINSISNATNKLWEYDPSTDTWTQKSNTFCDYVTPPE